MAKPKYVGLDYSSDEAVLDATAAIKQAAMALDVAAANAVESRDGETLTTVAALWLKMAESLEDQSGPEKSEEKSALGFSIHVPRNEEEIEADDSNGGS